MRKFTVTDAVAGTTFSATPRLDRVTAAVVRVRAAEEDWERKARVKSAHDSQCCGG